MPGEMQKFLINHLNAEPFNVAYTELQFDQLLPGQLLQVLSNVLTYIFQIEQIDIRKESAEDTAIRIFTSLRILRYKFNGILEDLEDWQAGIVEGSKNAVYPLLIFLFENLNALKERAYLSKFLMRTEIPGEISDYDTMELQKTIEDKMEEFKEVHQALKAIQADVALIDDIKLDLKSMEQEKQLLLRRIEKTEKRVANVPHFDKEMELASALRGEKEKLTEYANQRGMEMKKIVYLDEKITKLYSQIDESRRIAESFNEAVLIEKLENDLATNYYLADELLATEIANRKLKVRELSTMLLSTVISDADLDKLRKEIEDLSKEIQEMEEQRDEEEEVDENMSVFRHQVTTLERKKDNLVQKLQTIRQELSRTEKEVIERKRHLKDKYGGDMVSAVQYRKYLDDYRNKAEEQRKKRKDIDELLTEKAVLQQTVKILSKKYMNLENHIESIGGEIVEVLSVPQKFERPKTAAPKTNNPEEIRDEMKQMMATLDERKDRITDMRVRRDELKKSTKEKSDQLRDILREIERKEEEAKQNNRGLLDVIERLENEYARLEAMVPGLEDKLANMLELKNIVDMYGDDDKLPMLQEKLEEVKAREDELNLEISQMAGMEEIGWQTEMWKNLVTLFEIKIDVHNDKYNIKQLR